MAASESGSRVSAREPFFSSGYRAALERTALLPDGGRRVVEVSGAAVLRVISGLASNDVGGIEQGRAAYSFLLDRRGRVVVDLRVLPAPGFETSTDPPAVWLDVPAAALSALTHHLETYVPPIFAAWRPTAVRVVSLLGPSADEALDHRAGRTKLTFQGEPHGLKPLEATTARVGGRAGLLVRRERIEGSGFDLYVDPADNGRERGMAPIREQLEAAVTDVGGTIATDTDREVLRVERGLPAFGSELGPDRLAQEAGQDARAISFTKGCFTGQEVVARIHYRGHVNRHLRGIRSRSAELDRDGGPEPGTRLRAVADSPSPRPIGVVTSAVLSPRFGPIGLAYVRREIEPGDTVRAVGAETPEFQIVELPFTDE